VVAAAAKVAIRNAEPPKLVSQVEKWPISPPVGVDLEGCLGEVGRLEFKIGPGGANRQFWTGTAGLRA
jgi:hypothetical protein